MYVYVFMALITTRGVDEYLFQDSDIESNIHLRIESNIRILKKNSPTISNFGRKFLFLKANQNISPLSYLLAIAKQSTDLYSRLHFT